MQRMKHLTSGALFALLAASTAAYAQDDPKDQGGRSSEPAQRTGSAASRDIPSAEDVSDAAESAKKKVKGAQASAEGAAKGASWAQKLDSQQISQLQRELAARGFYEGDIDGKAGAQTSAALRAFQLQQQLDPSKGLDEGTREALGLMWDKQPVSGAQTSASPELERPVGQQGGSQVTGTKPMHSQVPLTSLKQDQMRMLQTKLQQLGFYQGSVDGKDGQGTRTALQRFFQTQADLASRGMMTDTTVSIFGMTPRDIAPVMGTSQGQPGTTMTPQGTSPTGQRQQQQQRQQQHTPPAGAAEQGTAPQQSPGTQQGTQGGTRQGAPTTAPRQGASPSQGGTDSPGTR